MVAPASGPVELVGLALSSSKGHVEDAARSLRVTTPISRPSGVLTIAVFKSRSLNRCARSAASVSARTVDGPGSMIASAAVAAGASRITLPRSRPRRMPPWVVTSAKP